MQLHLIESDKIYKEILETPIEKRDEVFKQKLLVPFINKFKILSNNILPSILPCQKIHLT